VRALATTGLCVAGVAAAVAGGALTGADPTSSAAARRPGAAPAKLCDRFAAASGDDSAPGTIRRPYRSVQRLVDSLQPGWGGCLLGGVYTENVNFEHGGRRLSRITLRTAPGYRRAVIHGNVVQNVDAPYVTIANVSVDARGVREAVAVQLLGDWGRLTGSVVAGGGEPDRIGVVIGFTRTAADVEIDHNRISGFGADSDKDHGIYVDNALRARVHDNFIFDNSGYGIHLWTHSIDGRFYDNTIDGNRSGNVLIGGQWNAKGGPSSGNGFYGNILSNPSSRKNVVVFWSSAGQGTPGSGNVVSRNCDWGGALVEKPGVTYADNVTADPSYVDREAKIFRLGRHSGCAGYGVRGPEDSNAAARRP
jgi:parallel beta-helix repeat protein